MLTIHEFGKENGDTLVLLHPLGVWWDIFSYVIPPLEKRFHLVIPAMPGLDPDRPETDFTSVEAIADEVTTRLQTQGLTHVACLYGCSMGGAVVIRMLAEGRIQTDCAVIDAGITPYRLPKPVTRLIGVRDFLMTEMGKHMRVSALKSVFDPSKYSEEDLIYVKKVLSSMRAKTIWRGFYSCNNYSMPSPVRRPDCPVQYWYGETEKKARKNDIAYVKEIFPDTEFVENPGQDHAEFFTLHPAAFCERLTAYVESCSKTERRSAFDDPVPGQTQKERLKGET